MSDDLEIALREFLVESQENLDHLDHDLLAVEADPGDRERIDAIFRTIHTVKGTCGFLALPRLEALAHAGESLLGRLRDGDLAWRPEISAALLTLVDAMRGMLRRIEATGGEGDEDDAAGLIEALRALEAGPAGDEDVDADLDGGPPPSAFEVEPVDDGPAHAPDRTPIPEHAPAPAAPAAHAALPAAVSALAVEAGNHPIGAGNIRVDVALLDRLMNLVGELVLARNQILQHSTVRDDAALLGASQRLNLITTELQEGVMKTRMQPIGNVWNTFPRVVRDLAVACGKRVRIEMEGSQTELDKTIIEAIKDPLTHLVRNAVDHGIEPPEARARLGKAEAGCLRLRAFHESGQVNIEISDDGAGIVPERVAAKAIERGLIGREQAARMSERELAQLLFLPGFSTAERVTNVSGRGVGLDVVKNHVERIGGTIDLASRPGLGTTFKIKIPLTLAIIPALIVRGGDGERYAIPQVNLLELVRLEGEQARRSIEVIRGAPVFRLRGELLPLVDLDRLLGGEPGPAAEAEAEGGAVNVVVVRADERQFGLAVAGIHDTEEIVVKPLGKQLKGIELYAGATIMGDGRVALILDVPGVAQQAGVLAGARRSAEADAEPGAARGDAERRSLLLFSPGGGRRMAIPLAMVARLEEIPRSAVERAGDLEVIQYRGQIIPLVRVADALGERDGEGYDGAGEDRPATMHVVVTRRGGRRAGLVVERILDTVEVPVRLEGAGRRHGLLGSAVIQQRVTDLLDVDGLLDGADVDVLEPATGGA